MMEVAQRWTRLRQSVFAAAAMAAVFVVGGARPAQALPSFAAQTGQPCTYCHIGAYGPQLTPAGRTFKIGGYTQTGGEGVAARIPLSVMALGSFTNTSAGVPSDQRVNRYASNSNFNFDQLSVFVAGGFGPYSGALMQFTGDEDAEL